MISVATYLARRLASADFRHAFLVTGGGSMFLNDALSHDAALTPIFFHHEQAAAMAAEAEFATTETIGMKTTFVPAGVGSLSIPERNTPHRPNSSFMVNTASLDMMRHPDHG